MLKAFKYMRPVSLYIFIYAKQIHERDKQCSTLREFLQLLELRVVYIQPRICIWIVSAVKYNLRSKAAASAFVYYSVHTYTHTHTTLNLTRTSQTHLHTHAQTHTPTHADPYTPVLPCMYIYIRDITRLVSQWNIIIFAEYFKWYAT